MSELPKWFIECRSKPVTSDLHDRWRLVTALAIACEKLERFTTHSGRTVYDYENEALDALRRINELGEDGK